VRVTLLLLLVAALAGAGALIAREERAAADARAAAKNIDMVSWRVLHDVSEARAGLQAYAVPGQDEAGWRKKVDAALERAAAGVEALRGQLNDPEALNDLDATSAALDALVQIEARASRLLGFDSRPQAGSLVFSDGLDAATTATRRLESARQAEQLAVEQSILARRRVQAAAAGGAGLVALGVALLLAPAPRAAAPASGAASFAAPEPVSNLAVAGSHEDAGTRESRAEGGSRESIGRLPLAESARTLDQASAGLGSVPAHAGSDVVPLRDAADLCTDFARLVDSQELPALLERAAALLDASGLIVWVADAPRQRLRPVLAHGYPAQALARLPAIPRDADNATAAAYRCSQVELVRSEGSSPGAVAVPILTGDGCVGVMAAELRHGRETSDATPALARIVAAQLAALVSIAPVQQAEPPSTPRTARAD
jgi:hypothetical protein